MSKTLDIIEQCLNIGDIKTISCNSGKNIKLIELLFSSTTKVQFSPSKDKKSIIFSVSDNHLGLPNLECLIEKETLRNYIIALKNIYNELHDKEESEVN